MPHPAVDYDAVALFGVYPQGIVEHAKNIEKSVVAIGDSLGRIIATFEKLELGWAGKSAQEAEDFAKEWIAVGDELFGPKGKPEQGALNIVLTGVKTVAYLFAHTEHGIADFFHQISVALSQPGSGVEGDGAAKVPGHGDSVIDVTRTAVTETWYGA